jgi:hypothetical protein
MRLPLAQTIGTRDGSLTKDAKLVNCYAEMQGQRSFVVKRPGITLIHSFDPGFGQGMFSSGGIPYAIIGDKISRVVSPFTQTVIPGVTFANLQYEFVVDPPYSATPFVVLKSTAGMWTFDGTTCTKVTDPDYPAVTVPGLVFLDGTFYVMTPSSVIQGSEIEDPTSWTALNFITSEGGAGSAVAIYRHLNYVFAFGDLATQGFYDANNAPPGTPLARADNVFYEVGCVSGYSIASMSNMTFFVSKSAQYGRGVSMFNGLSIEKISNEFIDRILGGEFTITGTDYLITEAGDRLTTEAGDEIILDFTFQAAKSFYSYCVKLNGHEFYVLTLINSDLTLVFDLNTKQWAVWKSSALQAPQSVSLLTSANGVATAQVSGHGFSDGDPVIIAGATPAGYNGQSNVTFVDVNTFTYPVGTGLATVTGIVTATGYSAHFFEGSSYTNSSVRDLVLDVDEGHVYEFDSTVYTDNGSPIDVLARTMIHDWETTDRKALSRLELIGDKVGTMMYARYSDDDYTTFSKYRPVSMIAPRSQLFRLGSFRRRSFDFRHTDNTPLRIEVAEIDLE